MHCVIRHRVSRGENIINVIKKSRAIRIVRQSPRYNAMDPLIVVNVS